MLVRKGRVKVRTVLLASRRMGTGLLLLFDVDIGYKLETIVRGALRGVGNDVTFVASYAVFGREISLYVSIFDALSVTTRSNNGIQTHGVRPIFFQRQARPSRSSPGRGHAPPARVSGQCAESALRQTAAISLQLLTTINLEPSAHSRIGASCCHPQLCK